MNSFILIFQSIIIPLILTIGIELGIWKVIQLTFKKYNFHYFWLSVIAINIATNPAFNVISSILDPTRTLFILEMILEILIIFIEATILYIIYKKEFSKFLILSSIINLFSYGLGLLLFTPLWI
ncbi:hypothetical protein K9L97_01730 [Candidatus Woesearchaeota archaeon]|nr:hypothetical protein [Candidatus Woesearchaeota archaeon]